MFKGTNLVGGDTYYKGWPVATGPVDGTHYKFVTLADIDALILKGCNAFRLVFGWEALQPTPKAAIPGAGNFGTYFKNLKALVDYATGKGATVLLDIHGGDAASFAAYFGIRVGGTYGGFPVKDLLVDFWSKMALIFKDNPRVAIGLTNEPHDIGVATWFGCVQAIINAVRTAGFNGLIVVPGVNWTHASTWVTSGSAAAFAALIDPAKNLAFQVHEYADANAGGGAIDIVSETVLIDRIKPAVDWARANDALLWLAELGFVATDAKAKALWTNLVAYMRTNADCVIGWAWWAYGPPSWWGGFRFALNPKTVGGADSAQMDLIEGELAAPLADWRDARITELEAEVAALTRDLEAARVEETFLTQEVGALRTGLIEIEFLSQNTLNSA